MSLTIAQAANDLLSKLGIEGTDPTVAPALAQQDVIIALNQAGQVLQRAGQDFFTRQYLDVTLISGQQEYALAQTVQAVLGPLRLANGVPLQALLSRGELDQFDRIFLGSASYGAAQGVPVAYWVEYMSNGDANGDIEQVNLYFCPIPTTNPGTVTAEVVLAWVNMAVADIGSTSSLPVARNYVESILLPLARWYVTRSSQFSRPELLPGLESDYQQAIASLGTAGGFPNAVQDAPAREVTA